jgi:acyl-CoA synthetase (AMP-forming)/AMP-acid ligase II
LQRITSAEAEDRQRRVAGALAGRGLQPGQRAAFVVPSSVDLLCAVMGALRTGIVPVLLNPALLAEERDLLLDDADPAVVVDTEEQLRALGAGAPAELAAVPLGRPMHYTSGTSGRPKGVWSGVLDEDAATALVDDEREVWAFADTDVHLVCSPLFHSAAIRFAAGTLLAGGDVVLLPRFEAEAAASAIASERPTTAFMAPAHLQRLFALPRLPELGSFRLLAHAGAPCPAPLKRAALSAFPKGAVWEFYGSTEGQFTVCPPSLWEEKPGTVGRARPRRTMSVDGDGVIWCAVPSFARFEYWRDPDKTAAAWRGDAFTVGDLGRIDDDGCLFLDGRRDDLIISGGVNVYPAEVEDVLAGVRGVGEVAVFGAPDERWGQRVCAAVVPDGPVDADSVIDHARRHLTAYKCPKEVYVLDALPRTATGKLRRSLIADQLGLDGEG